MNPFKTPEKAFGTLQIGLDAGAKRLLLACFGHLLLKRFAKVSEFHRPSDDCCPQLLLTLSGSRNGGTRLGRLTLECHLQFRTQVCLMVSVRADSMLVLMDHPLDARLGFLAEFMDFMALMDPMA